jgi:signal transduction histidine kinase
MVIINFYIYLNARKNPLLYTYLAVQGLLFIWLISKIFKTVSPSPDIRWFFIVTQYFGNCFLGSTFFAFAYTYSKGNLPRIKLLLATGIPSLFFFLCMVTNPRHMLFYSHYDFYSDSFGPLFYIHQIYTYIMMLAGIYLCSKRFFYDYHHKRIQAAIISIAVFIPVLANIFYILKLYKLFFGFRPLFDITPITCNLSLVLFALATFKFRFLDILSIARRTAFNQIPEGILLFTKGKRIADLNLTAASTGETSEISQMIIESPDSEHPIEQLYTASTEKQFRVQWIPSVSGYILRFVDDTSYQQALQALSDKNQLLSQIHRILNEKAQAKQALAIYKTRNYIGREVHDILGHSIVLALSVLEVAKICSKDRLSLSMEKIEQAIGVLQEAMKKMKNDLPRLGSDIKVTKTSFISDVKTLIQEINNSGQNVTLTFQGNPATIPRKIHEAAIRLCQESVTNAIRHGRAKKIDIIVRMSEDLLELYIIDNGTGCSNIKKGFGLRGMEERIIFDLKGTLNYGSLDKGFAVSAVIPIQAI